jgi:hypothetical protein
MTQIQRAVTTVFVFACSLSLGPGTPVQASQDSPAIAAFNGRVQDYVRLHRRLEGPVPVTKVSRDMAEVRRAMDSLAAGIKRERGGFRQGEFFTADVARDLKALISEGCGGDLRGLLAIVQEETPAGLNPPPVGSRWPVEAGHAMIPPNVLCRLPSLPEELQYGFVGGHLVLWDMHADLVLDVLPNVLRTTWA